MVTLPAGPSPASPQRKCTRQHSLQRVHLCALYFPVFVPVTGNDLPACLPFFCPGTHRLVGETWVHSQLHEVRVAVDLKALENALEEVTFELGGSS